MPDSKKIRRRSVVRSLAGIPLIAATSADAQSPQRNTPGFRSSFALNTKRPWIGPEYWSNPLQDWQLNNGRVECMGPGGDRNLFRLTHSLSKEPAPFTMSVRLGQIESQAKASEGFAGFRVGIDGVFGDYRDAAVRGTGLNAGVLSDGRMFIGQPEEGAAVAPLDDVILELAATPAGGTYNLVLRARNAALKQVGEIQRAGVPADWLTGGVALVCSSGKVNPTPVERQFPTAGNGGQKPGTARVGNLRFWFKDWLLTGAKVEAHPDRAWGPILWTMYTLSRGVLKLTAQLAPVENFPQADLLVERGGRWQPVATTRPDPLSCVAAFRIANWDATADVKYRVRFANMTYDGTVRRDPKDKPKLVVGALTCQNDHGFPHQPVTNAIKASNPDILFFTGDQIYERNAEYGVQRDPEWAARLDYLRKWFLFGWAWRDLIRDVPTACLPDDHDVYHGNLWGASGRKAEGTGKPGQDSGGYTMPAAWVNMVERTQCWNLPDPADPAPVDQNISVHFCDLRWGGVSFALLEDRKFKSAPKIALPGADIENGWSQTPGWNAAKQGDVPGAELLGKRQEAFLEKWAADWSGGTWMKVAVSATIFANLATLPAPANNDDVTPGLPVQKPGDYPAGEIVVADHDSNGWPQGPRNRAVRLLRKALALHIAGDQHLGSTIQYGADEWNDGSFAFCTPAISNLWPRRWYPPKPGRIPKARSPRNTGEFVDGFGNKMTVHAVANPEQFGVAPFALNNAAPGYGVVELDRATRKITLTNWPRWATPGSTAGKPYPGWPIEIRQTDNGLPKGWVLPELDAEISEPIVQVTEDTTKEVVYTLRIMGTRFIPTVGRPGKYIVRVFDPDRKYDRVFAALEAAKG